MITLPWPPTVNHYYSVFRGRKILSKRGRDYKKQAALELMLQNPDKHKGEISISIHAHPPDKRRRDIDNLIKPLLDVLVTAGVITDDSDVHDLRIQRFPKQGKGMIKIWVSAW